MSSRPLPTNSLSWLRVQSAIPMCSANALPIEQPTKFDFVINLRAAKAGQWPGQPVITCRRPVAPEVDGDAGPVRALSRWRPGAAGSDCKPDRRGVGGGA